MKRTSWTTLLAALAALAMVAFAPAALARSPQWALVPLASFSLDASYCGFPVQVDLLVNKEYSKASTLEDGTTVLHVTGSSKYLASSPTTSITVNASGPADVTISPDGTVTIRGRGHGLQPFTAAQAEEAGVPRLALLVGLTVLRFSPDGSATLIHSTRVVDLCTELAA